MLAPYIFAIALVLFAYPFLIYPLLVLRVRGRVANRFDQSSDESWPRVALVICALNEERIIGEKLENSLRLEYPGGRLRIILISDGSKDRTASIARSFVSRGIEFINLDVDFAAEFREEEIKDFVINEVISRGFQNSLGKRQFPR